MKNFCCKSFEIIKRYIIILLIYLIGTFLCNCLFSYNRLPTGILVHLLLYMSIVSIFMKIFRSEKTAFSLINLLEFLFACICYLKIETRCQVLEPWDVYFASNLISFADFLTFDAKFILLVFAQFVFATATTIIQIYLFEKYCTIPKKSFKSTCLIVVSVISIVFLTTQYMPIKMKYIDSQNAGYANYSRYRKVGKYGALCTFLLDIGMMINNDVPEEYSREKVQEMYDTYKLKNIDDEQMMEYDNVIVVLMESFMDVTKLPGVEFKNDPLKNYHKYANDLNSGYMDVINIGGGTANTEYSVLTMYSTDQYLTGTYPYIHYIKRDLEVLPRVFKNNGYKVTGIHTWNEGFYNRNNSYNYMGFDEFISDDDFDKPQYYGDYISDVEIYNKITELVEKEGKNFISVSTMSAHTPYDYFTKETCDEWINPKGLTETTVLKLNNYVQQIRKTDELLGLLMEYVKNSDENTLLIMYGDHYPLMYGVYKQMGIVDIDENNISKEKYPYLYQMPYMVCSNCEDIVAMKKISPSALGTYILENVKLEDVPWYYMVIYDYVKNGNNYEEYIMIQYDELFGERYWKSVEG